MSDAEVRVLRAQASDSGSWACVALGAGGGGRLVLRVLAVAVRRALPARRTLPLALHCGALQLAMLYDELEASWTLDGRPFQVGRAAIRANPRTASESADQSARRVGLPAWAASRGEAAPADRRVGKPARHGCAGNARLPTLRLAGAGPG